MIINIKHVAISKYMTISFEELKYYNDVEPLNNTNCYDWSYAWKIVLIRM